MTGSPSGVRRSAVILVGGRSTRMGAPKALVELAGEPLLGWVTRTLALHCDEVILAAAHVVEKSLLDAIVGTARAALHAPDQPLRVTHDSRADQGPVAGLAEGLAAARAPFAFVSSCDTPLVSDALVEALFTIAERATGPLIDVVLPSSGGRLEPLVAVYRTAMMAPHFAHQLERGGGSPGANFAALHVRKLEAPELTRIDPEGRSFFNVNSPEDLAAAALLAERKPLSTPVGRRSHSRKGSSGGG